MITRLQRIQITRVDYECRFGQRADDMAIGAILCDDNGNAAIEFVFMTTQQEIATLEYLHALD